MKTYAFWNRLATLPAAFLLLTACTASAQAAFISPFPDPPESRVASSSETAVFAGGCFWGMEGIFERLRGVKDVISGYSGGEASTAHYEMVGTGETGHAESIQITFDPKVISYGTLLKVFFSIAHNPTELDYQGPDHGTQYRSAVFFTDAGQKTIAEEYIKKLDAAKIFPDPIVTQVVPLKSFFPAEDYHQNFMKTHPDYPYIVYWDLPKMKNLEKAYPSLLASR